MTRRLIPAILVSLAVLSGCGTKAGDKTGSPPPAASTPLASDGGFKVALLTTGPVTDGGWNQSAWEGVQKIQKDLGATVDKQENLKESQFTDAFRDFANRGYNLIIG